MKKIILISLCLYLIHPIKALASSENFELKEFNSCSFCSFKIGFKLQSLTDHRGVITEPNAQVMPGVAAYFFNDQLEVIPTSLSFFHYIDEPNIRFRYRLYQITDKPMVKLQSQDTSSYIHRENTIEAQFRIETFWGGNSDDYVAEFDLAYSKDIKTHWGDYFEILTKFKLESFVLSEYNLVLEPNFFASLGWGNSSHNQYVYGPQAQQSTFNNYAYGLWLAIPNRADRYYPIVMIKHFQTMNSDLKQADYARGHDSGIAASLIYSVKVL